MRNELVLKKLLMNYFSEEVSFSDSNQIITELGIKLGDDIIYGAISNGSKYLINKINKAFDKKNLGQLVLSQLDNLIDVEYNLAYTNLLIEQQGEILNKLENHQELSFQDTLYFNKAIEECNYLLSSEDKVCFKDVEYCVNELSNFQKFVIICDITSERKEHFRKKCCLIYEIIDNMINKNMVQSYQLKKNQPK